MTPDVILNEFAKYTSGEMSLGQFEEWVVSHLQETLDYGDEASIALMDEVDALLLELGENSIDEKQFMDGIAGMITEAETVRISLPVGASSSSNSIVRHADLSGRDAEIRIAYRVVA